MVFAIHEQREDGVVTKYIHSQSISKAPNYIPSVPAEIAEYTYYYKLLYHSMPYIFLATVSFFIVAHK